jgi:acyl carrier protein
MKGKDKIERLIKQLIEEKTGIKAEHIANDCNFFYDLTMDLGMFYELIHDIEFNLEVELPFDKIDRMTKFEELFTFVWELKSCKLN